MPDQLDPYAPGRSSKSKVAKLAKIAAVEQRQPGATTTIAETEEAEAEAHSSAENGPSMLGPDLGEWDSLGFGLMDLFVRN